MSGMRSHKIYKVTIEGEVEFYPRDSMGEVCGDVIRKNHTTIKNIIASQPGIAEAHVRYWIPFTQWVGSPTVTVDKGSDIDAFIEEHIW
jgi:hypothetical protein